MNSAPLSLTIMPGLPRRAINARISRTARFPDGEVSGMAARHSLVTSSMIVSTRNRRPLASWSWIEPWGRHWSEAHGEGRSTSGCWARRSLGSARAPPRSGAGTCADAPPGPPRRRAGSGLLAVHGPALAAQKDMQAAAAEPSPLIGQFPQPGAQTFVIGTSGAIADRAPVRGDHRARPPPAHPEARPEMRDGFPPGGGRHHFFVTRPFSPALSGIASA